MKIWIFKKCFYIKYVWITYTLYIENIFSVLNMYGKSKNIQNVLSNIDKEIIFNKFWIFKKCFYIKYIMNMGMIQKQNIVEKIFQ